MKKDIKRSIRNVLLVILGTFILAFSTAIFLIPSNLVTGGMSGVAIVIDNIYSIPTGNLPFNSIDIYVFIMEWGLFILGWIFFGKDFSLKTLVSAICYPIFLSLCQKLVTTDFLNGFFMIKPDGYTSIMLCALFGGLFTGAGVAVTFIGGGSTGGLDILALILCKFIKGVKSSTMVFVCDGLVVVFGVFVLKDFVLCLLGIVAAQLCALAIDKIFIGRNQAFIAQIISDKYQEISDEIIKQTERSTTILDVIGGYTNINRKMVMVSYSMAEYATVSHIVALIDKNAFMTIHRAHEINGEGWTRPSPEKEENNEESNNQKNEETAN